MKGYLILATSLAAFASVPASPQTPTTRVEQLDPARLTAAAKLLDISVPPERRDAMIDGMMKAMTANMANAMRNSSDLAKLFGSDPRVQPIFERFMLEVRNNSTQRLKSGMPGMIQAMTRAYARRFTTAQMEELSAFFATPTGRLYMEQAPTIMADPDVAAWQAKLTTESFSRLPEQARKFRDEIYALDPPVKIDD